jgi:ABC-type uncharacterized transport system fused permease/ATPase subunit
LVGGSTTTNKGGASPGIDLAQKREKIPTRVAMLYSGLGSAIAHLIGRPLIRLNNRQLRSRVV